MNVPIKRERRTTGQTSGNEDRVSPNKEALHVNRTNATTFISLNIKQEVVEEMVDPATSN
jgi:hypothetical protein